MITDSHGIIGQIEQDGSVDGGDSVGWMGHHGALADEAWPVAKYISTFEVKPGLWVRHPDKGATYAGWGAFENGPYDGVISRDQLTGILHNLAIHRQYRALGRYLKQWAKRGFLFSRHTVINGQNPVFGKPGDPDIFFFLKCIFGMARDRRFPGITFMDIWAMAIRGFYPYSLPLYPLLLLLDLQTVVNSVILRLVKPGEVDVVSHVGRMLLGSRVMPTPSMWLAKLISGQANMRKRLKLYWTGWRQQPDMYGIYLLAFIRYY